MTCPILLQIWARSAQLGALLDKGKIMVIPTPEIDRDLAALAIEEACRLGDDIMEIRRTEPPETRICSKCPSLILPPLPALQRIDHGPASRDWQRAAWKGLHYGGTLKKRPKSKKGKRP